METTTTTKVKELKAAREAEQTTQSKSAMYGSDTIAELCAKYDKNGDGTFCIDE